MSDLPSRIPLAPGDYYMHGQDWRMRCFGLPGNVCRVSLRLDRGLDVSKLREHIETSRAFDWLSRLHIRRRWPVLPARWEAKPEPQPFFQEHAANGISRSNPTAFPKAVTTRQLHASEGPAVAFDLIHHNDGTHDLILSWNHALMDARGAEMVLRHIQAQNSSNVLDFSKTLIQPEQVNGGFSKWWNSMGRARRSLPWLKESGKGPLFTLLPPGSSPTNCVNKTRAITFSAEESAQMNARCAQLNAAFRRSHFYLAASLRAVHAVATKRGQADKAYLIPVPHDTRRRGAKGPVFSNHLSILFYRIAAELATDTGAVVEELTRQMMDQIRTEFPRNAMSALEMFKVLPLNLYLYQLGKPSGGRFASFCFSDSGETCAGFREVMGASIQSVMHVIPTWRPPGLTILFWSFSGRPYALISYADDCLTEDEADLLERVLRSALVKEAVE